MTKRDNISYFAGIIDGEGCISINYERKRGSYKLRISITNTDKPLLDWVQENYGGTTYERKKQKEHYKRKYEWVLYIYKPQQHLLEMLSDILIIKKEQALKGLELLNLSGQRGEEVREKRKQIKLLISNLKVK